MSRAIHKLSLFLYGVVDLTRDVALQASDGLHLGVPLGHLLGDIFLGALVGPEPPYGDDVDRGVRLPVAAAVEPVPICHSRRDGNGRDAAEHGEGRLRPEPFGVVADRDHQLRRRLGADALELDQQRGGVGQYRGYHIVELGDLIVQVDVALGEVLQGYLGGAKRGPEVGRVRPRRDQTPYQLHARHAAQLVAQLLGRRYHVRPYHLQRDPSRRYGRRPGLLQHPEGFDHAVAALRRDGPRTGERRLGGHLRVDEVVLAALPAHGLVGEGHFQHGKPVLGEMSGQAAPVRPGALHPDPEHVAQRPRPRLELAVSLPGRREAFLADQRPLPVHGRRHVYLLVRCPCFGLCMPGSFGVRFALRALAEPAAGQDSNGMHRRHLALLGSRTGEARASVGTAPSSRHIRGMTWRRSLCGSGYRSGPVNRSAGQDAATRSRLAGYGSVPVAAKPADDILTIAVMHAPIGRVSPGQGHLQCLVCELGRDARAHRPAHYAARPYVHHERQVQPALPGLHASDVGEPRHVGAVRLEPAPRQVRRRFAPRGPLRARGPFGARARDAAPSALAHDAGHALARRARPERPQPHERLGRAVDIPHLGSGLGYQFGELFVAQGVRAGRPRLPRVVALPGRLQRRAHLRHRPVHFVEEYELELRPLPRKAYSCLLAKKALAIKSISFSLFRRPFSRFSLRRSSAIWNGLASGAGPAASAFLTQSDRPPASQPSPRATSAYVVPDFLRSSTAFCLNSAVYLGDGLPMARLAFLRCGHHAETEIDLSTEMGRIQIQIQIQDSRPRRGPSPSPSRIAVRLGRLLRHLAETAYTNFFDATRSAAGSPFFFLVTVVSNLPRATPWSS